MGGHQRGRLCHTVASSPGAQVAITAAQSTSKVSRLYKFTINTPKLPEVSFQIKKKKESE